MKLSPLTILAVLVASLAGGCGQSAAPTAVTPRPAGGLKDEPAFGPGGVEPGDKPPPRTAL